MPELPEVETVRRGLNQVTLHQTILGGDVLRDRTIAHPFSIAEFLIGLQGAAIVQWHRRGKYLLAELVTSAATDRAVLNQVNHILQGETPFAPTDILNPHPSSLFPIPHFLPFAGWLCVHLRMTGQLLWVEQSDPLQKHTRVRLFFPNGRELRFVDQRTFGQMWRVPSGKRPEEVVSGLVSLGPEPFSVKFSVAYLEDGLHDRKRPIKNALLDQTLVAGIGNIYADEALFLSHIQPQTLCSMLNSSQIQTLHAAILRVLQEAIDARGTTFSDFRDVAGVNGNYGGVAWVYDRKGQPCRVCQMPIERIKLGGRSAHFCPTCQQ
ncbi:MAG: DNA-formamidopyrimidine glycosylase [Cyanobacteria bacterium CRU_2_1]|nr:DNA-formamidopyrimidine glycosylase [Cyanobacteria bacterium CRU_2_1]